MIITVFGATGMVGRRIVSQALALGHHVKAYGRNIISTGFAENENLALIQGTLFDEEPVYEAIKGSDVVISAIGGAFDGVDQTRSLGMRNIVLQMEKAGVKRIIAIGGMGILNAADDNLILDTPQYPQQYVAVGKEHFKAYQHLANSGLEWTMVAPPDIQDADVTGSYFTQTDTLPAQNQFSITAGDLALFMLNEAQRGEFIGRRVGISN